MLNQVTRTIKTSYPWCECLKPLTNGPDLVNLCKQDETLAPLELLNTLMTLLTQSLLPRRLGHPLYRRSRCLMRATIGKIPLKGFIFPNFAFSVSFYGWQLLLQQHWCQPNFQLSSWFDASLTLRLKPTISILL